MNDHSFEALIPPEMAEKAEDAGVKKANLEFLQMFPLAVLAGAFIALGAIFATTVTTMPDSDVAFGLSKLAGGFVFCLGLVLVVVAGAELFTGNNLIVMAWASGKVSTTALLRNWGIVYLGNFVGSVFTALGLYLSGYFRFGDGAVGRNALDIANGKVSIGFIEAIMLGVFCNILVCLAVWLSMSARTTTDKILAVIFPITAFVAAGFEHSVANMYFIPAGLFVKSGSAVDFNAADYANLTWGNFLVANLLPVTIGNIFGGAVLVGLVYWFIYLRPRSGS